MGTMFNSFKRQVGKDAGKALSNAVFGDGHSTPYRRVEPKVTAASITAKVREEKLELEKNKVQEEQRIKAAEMEQKHRLETAKMEQEKAQDHHNRIAEVAEIVIPEDKNERITLMNQLLVKIKSVSWSKDKRTNEYADALLAKYKQCLFALKHQYPESFEIPLGDAEYKKLSRSRFIKKNKKLIITAICILAFVVICIIDELTRK